MVGAGSGTTQAKREIAARLTNAQKIHQPLFGSSMAIPRSPLATNWIAGEAKAAGEFSGIALLHKNERPVRNPVAI
jgi:hypothetical protein